METWERTFMECSPMTLPLAAVNMLDERRSVFQNT